MKSSIIKVVFIMATLTSVAIIDACKKGDNSSPQVGFSKDILPIFTSDCAINSGCHSGASNQGDNIDLDSTAAYNTIITKQLVNTAAPTSSLLYVEVSSGTMPKAPYGHLSAAQVSQILNWIKQGATNN